MLMRGRGCWLRNKFVPVPRINLSFATQQLVPLCLTATATALLWTRVCLAVWNIERRSDDTVVVPHIDSMELDFSAGGAGSGAGAGAGAGAGSGSSAARAKRKRSEITGGDDTQRTDGASNGTNDVSSAHASAVRVGRALRGACVCGDGVPVTRCDVIALGVRSGRG